MKRLLFLLLLLFIVKDALYCIIFRPQENKEPLGVVTQQAVRVVAQGKPVGKTQALLDSQFVSQLISIDLLQLLQHLKHEVAEQTLRRPQGMEPLELVPQDAIFMLDLTGATAVSKSFFASRFGRTLTTIDWFSVLDQLEVKAQYRALPVEWISRLRGFLENPLVMAIFSKRVVIAQLPVSDSLFKDNPQQQLMENLLVLVNLRQHNGGAALLFLLTLLQEHTDSLHYQGIAISTVDLAHDRKLYLAFVDKLLLISPGLEPLQHSIDLFINHLVRQETGFLQNTAYRKMKEHGQGKDDFFLYTDLIRLKSLLNMAGLQGKAGEIRNIPGFAGSERMVLFHSAAENSEQFSSIVQFSQDQLNPFQKEIYTRKPLQNQSLRRMPAGLLVYFWSNWLDPAAWWQATIAMGNEDELAAAGRVAGWLETQTEMNIDRFLALFGQEFGFNIAEISTAGFFPVPRICCCIEVTDRGKVRELLEKMIAGLPVRRNKVAGVPVVSLMVANGMMQPSYALTDRFLLVADGRDQIEEILTNSPKPLIMDEEFQAVDRGMEQPSNLLLFARSAELVEGLKEFASWAGTVIAIRDEAAGTKSKVLVDQVILPLLDGLKMYRAQGLRSYTAPGEVMVDAVVLHAEPETSATGQ